MCIHNVELLDCTIRDGGQGLEYAANTDFSYQYFTNKTLVKLTQKLVESKIEIIELGAINSVKYNENLAIYESIEDLSSQIIETVNNNQRYSAFYLGPDTPYDDIPNWNSSLCKIVRVVMRYSELEKSLSFCKELAKKGYKVCIQPIVTMRYSDEELKLLIRTANEICAYALYIVDSYGCLLPEDLEKYVQQYDKYLNDAIKIGFHAHNHMSLAYANSLSLINKNINRNIIIDSCIMGMGQGAGNLQTEMIVPYINSYRQRYSFDAVLDACEIIEKYLSKNTWGYSLEYLLPAIHRVAYKYARVFHDQYGLHYKEINRIFANLPEEIKYRYTYDTAIKILDEYGYRG